MEAAAVVLKWSQTAAVLLEGHMQGVLASMAGDRPKTRCVKCVPKCASVRVAPSNIVYYCTDKDPQGKVN